MNSKLSSPDKKSPPVEKTPQQQMAAAIMFSFMQQKSGQIMEYPSLVTDIRHLHQDRLTWSEVTREMRPDLMRHKVARAIEFSRSDYFGILKNAVAKAHNDRKRFDPTIRTIKEAVRDDSYLYDLVEQVMHEKGDYGAPLRIWEVRQALIDAFLRPKDIDESDSRFSEKTKKIRKQEIRAFNRLARVSFGEMHLEELGHFDPSIWNEEAIEPE